MRLPIQLPLSDSPTIITAYTEATDGTTTWSYVSYYHIPLTYHLLVVFLFVFILARVVIEFLIRIRKPTEKKSSGIL